jgi:hypothetical protein
VLSRKDASVIQSVFRLYQPDADVRSYISEFAYKITIVKRQINTLVSIIVTALLAAGCATNPANPELHVSSGDPLITGPQAIESGPPQDKSLWQYRMASAHLHHGEFVDAKVLLDEALGSIGVVITDEKSASQSRSLFYSEAKKKFLGEPYERVMACYYRGILYWMEGEPDNARACFRTGEIMDTGQIVQSNGQTNNYSADFVLLDYLDGLITTKLGADGADALERSRTSAKGFVPPAYNPKTNTFVFIEYGSGPAKIAEGKQSEILRFAPRESLTASVAVKVGSETQELKAYDDLYFQATTRGGRLMDEILENKAKVKETAEVVGNIALLTSATAALGQNRDVALIGLGVGVASKIFSNLTKPRADTRNWDNLPGFLAFSALELPPGQQTLTVEFLDSANNPLPNLTKTINLDLASPGSDTIVFVSDQSVSPDIRKGQVTAVETKTVQAAPKPAAAVDPVKSDSPVVGIPSEPADPTVVREALAAQRAASEPSTKPSSSRAAVRQLPVTVKVPAQLAPAPGSQSREQRLSRLLELYKADYLSPLEYHEQRAKIIEEP